LAACFREIQPTFASQIQTAPSETEISLQAKPSYTLGAIVFGSDQGLVGQFNEVVADYAIQALHTLQGSLAKSSELQVWAVGERVNALLVDAGLSVAKLYSVPTSVAAIIPLVGKLQIENESLLGTDASARVFVFHNKPQAGGQYQPTQQRLLPFDGEWQRRLAAIAWPTPIRPQLLAGARPTLIPLIREYLFISLFRACAESLAGENASRLAAMERAEKNIGDMREQLNRTFNQLRQSGIDEELFDVISGSLLGSSQHEASPPLQRPFHFQQHLQ
jgi:F-type H+-transporting ATPase subunit gamma